MAKVWIPTTYDNQGEVDTEGHFEGEDDPGVGTGDFNYPVVPTTPAVPDTGGWTTDEVGNKYKIDSKGNLTFKDAKGTDYTYNTAKGGFTDAAGNLAGEGVVGGLLNKINGALGTNLSVSDLGKLAIGAGGLAGALGAGNATTKPTGYQGGIPTLTASQPMLTEPPPGRRPGSGGINYGTGVQYKDKDGKIVSDTSTFIADLYKKATQDGTYNEWNHQYGQGTTGSTNAANDQSGLLALLQKQQAAQAAATATPSGGLKKIASAPTGTTGTTAPNTGIASALPSASSAASIPTGGGFVTGGGGPPSDAEYAKMVAVETARRNAEQAALDKWNISRSSPFYAASKGLTGKALDNLKSQDKDFQERITNRQAASDLFVGSDFMGDGDLKDAQGNKIAPNENETNRWVSYPNGSARYITKAEAAQQVAMQQKALMSQGSILDPNKPWNIASTNASTQSAQQALAQLNTNPGADPQATLNNFLKTTTFTPEQLAAASNGQWGVNDLKTQMAGNPNLPEQGGPKGQDKTSAGNEFPDMTMGDPSPFNKTTSTNWGDPASWVQTSPKQTAKINAVLKSLGVGGTDSTPTTNVPTGGLAALATQAAEQPQFNGGYPMEGGIKTPQFNGGYPMQIDPTSIYQNPGNPVAPPDLFQQIYGRSGTPEEQAAMAGKSPEEESAILQQSLANWNASQQSTPQVDTPSAQPDYNQNYGGFAKGGLTNLDHGGFVIPADVVSHFGNGSSSAGLELLAQNMGAEPIRGQGDGMSDSIPAAIDGREKALVANDEAYLSPQMVERLGDGDMDAGSRKLKQMMEKIRQARTGSKEQGKQINPNNFMPGGTVGYAQGGGIKSFVTGGTTDPTASLVQSGVTGTEQNLSNYAGPAVTQMLGQAQALANTPYQAYTGPLTAGASDLQTQAFNTAANLPGSDMATGFAQQAGASTYTPQSTNFGAAQAQQYMNPYLQASLDPQLAEARRQSQITAQNNAASMTKAGAFGGGRQAIMSSENDRNLGTNLANITGQGYNTAYQNAMGQFNADQNRQMQENQFGANFGLQSLQAGISGLNAANQMGINNLNTQANLGATQRGIEGEGIAADKLQFEEARKDPYTKLQFQQSMLNGMPITAQNYNMSQPSAFTSAAGGATTVAQLLKNLGIGT